MSYLIVHLQTGKHGIFKAHIYPHHMVHQSVRLMSFERGGDGQTGSCVSVQDVHQFLLLDGTCEQPEDIFNTRDTDQVL